MAADPIALDKQIACVRREIALRKNVYPKLVARGVKTQEFVEYEIQAMEAVLETLRRLNAP